MYGLVSIGQLLDESNLQHSVELLVCVFTDIIKLKALLDGGHFTMKLQGHGGYEVIWVAAFFICIIFVIPLITIASSPVRGKKEFHALNRK